MVKSLSISKKKTSGRNNLGHISIRHRGGGHRKAYKIIDFNRYKMFMRGIITNIEYDPNRTSYIALVCYKDGVKRYILQPTHLKLQSSIFSSYGQIPLELGNCMPLKFITIGVSVHSIEMIPLKGGQIGRSAGSSGQVVGKNLMFVFIRLKSGKIKKFFSLCRAVVGTVSNKKQKSMSKAGQNRWKGVRPTVRGVAMNLIDHPHGGGEGKTSGGRHPVSPWGKGTKGKKTKKILVI
ncbi:UNVERIFIED_CONTAM: hypothetical protein GTU68_026390 [Idotea baltica]|nr:hypothetical protein [Idotea baltica]